jgi:hypothetical protein
VNLKDEKPTNKYLIDNTWLPSFWKGKTSPSQYGPTHRGPVLTWEEEQLLKSGAKLQEILFMRLIKNSHEPALNPRHAERR